LPDAATTTSPSTGLTAKEQELQKDNIAFVENLVIPNYKQLADESIELETAMETLRSKTDKRQPRQSLQLVAKRTSRLGIQRVISVWRSSKLLH
jgi:uncharacterized membrane protein YccC